MESNTTLKRMPRATHRPSSSRMEQHSGLVIDELPESTWFSQRRGRRNRSAPAPLTFLTAKRTPSEDDDNIVPFTPDSIHLDRCMITNERPRALQRQPATRFVMGHNHKLHVVEPTMSEALGMEVKTSDGKIEPLVILRPATTEGMHRKIHVSEAWDAESCTASLDGEGDLTRPGDETFGSAIKRRVKGLFRSVKR